MRRHIGLGIGFFAVMCVASAGVAGFTQKSRAGRRTRISNKAEIEALEQRYLKAFNARDVSAIMENYAPGSELFVFDAIPPREYPSWESYKKDCEGLFAAFPGPVHDTMSELHITVVGPVAYAHHIEETHFTQKGGAPEVLVIRVTDVFRKMHGKWLIVQEHVSFPVDLSTGKADLLSRP